MEIRERGTSRKTFLVAIVVMTFFLFGYFYLSPSRSVLDTNVKVMDVLGDLRGRLDSLGMVLEKH